jgi:hypothetical protein
LYRTLVAAALIAYLLACVGCATLAHGTRQDVRVTSDPPGAAVTVLTRDKSGKDVVRSRPGVTPIVLSLTRRDPNIVVRLEKEGCSPVDVPLKRSVSAWTAGNLIIANPLSMQGMDGPSTQYPFQLAMGLPLMFGVDAASGGAFKLPKHVTATLCAR